LARVQQLQSNLAAPPPPVPAQLVIAGRPLRLPTEQSVQSPTPYCPPFPQMILLSFKNPPHPIRNSFALERSCCMFIHLQAGSISFGQSHNAKLAFLNRRRQYFLVRDGRGLLSFSFYKLSAFSSLKHKWYISRLRRRNSCVTSVVCVPPVPPFLQRIAFCLSVITRFFYPPSV